MTREQQTGQESQREGASPGEEREEDFQGVPPYLYRQVLAVRPDDVDALVHLLALYPPYKSKIAAIASTHLGLALVQRAIRIDAPRHAEGKGGSLSHRELEEMGIDNPAAGPEQAAPQPEAARVSASPGASATGTKPLSKAEEAAILHDASDPKPLSKAEEAAILHDASDPKALSKAEEAEILHDASDPKVEPGWVADARKYNARHATLVDDFNELTAKLCLDWDKGEEGPLDPTKVATWQGKHGLVADGKVGPRTVAAARATKGEQVAQGDLLGDDARPPV
jgi:hypothetical protein